MRISTLLGTGSAVAVAAAVGSRATTPEVGSGWYRQLRKPAYQPPPQAFPVVGGETEVSDLTFQTRDPQTLLFNGVAG